MWKYVIIWGLYLMLTDESLPGKERYFRIASDSAVFYNRDIAFNYSGELYKNWLTAPNNKKGKVGSIRIDSFFIPEKRNLFDRLFKRT